MSVVLSSTVRAGRLLRLLGWITAAFAISLIAASAIPYIQKDVPITGRDVAFTAATVLVSAVYLIVGAAIKRHKPRARKAGAVLSVVSLPVIFPIGAVLVIITLVYLVRGWKEPLPALEPASR